MKNLKKYRYPIILTTLSLGLLLTFQRCGGSKGGGGESSSSSSSPVVVSSSFAPDSYFVEYKDMGTNKDSLIVGFILGENNQFTGYKIKFFGGNYTAGYYQISKGSYQFTTGNKFSVTYTKDTCNDLTPENFDISGIAGDAVYLKQDSTALKFFSEKKWQPSVNFQSNNAALIEDTDCNKI